MKTVNKFAALKTGSPWKFCGASDPRCPHCGSTCDATDDFLYEEGSHDMLCSHCKGDFTVKTRVSYSFDTDEQDGA